MPIRIGSHKATLEIPLYLWTAITRLATSRQTSISEMVRRALWVLLELDKRVEDGWEIILRKEGREASLLLEPTHPGSKPEETKP